MENTSSTPSQTPRYFQVSRLSQYIKGPIQSPRLQKKFERLQAEQSYQLMQNRLEKLKKVELTIHKEIKFADRKSKHLFSLQQENFSYSQRKKDLKRKLNDSIESKRRSLSISRQESRFNREKSFADSYLQKKSKAQLLKSLKKGWNDSFCIRKEQESRRKQELAQRVKDIRTDYLQERSRSQAMERNQVKKRVNRSLEIEQEVTHQLRERVRMMEGFEQDMVSRLGDTISIRNQKLNGLNKLMAVSKLPLSLRSV